MSETDTKQADIILEADAVYHVYESKAEDGNVVALRGLNIAMRSGEAVAVVGPSGSGESTLMKCLGGLMKPSAGSVSLDGRNMTRLTGQELVKLRQQTVSFIFQEGNLLNDLNARDNVAQPLINQGVRSRVAKRKALDLLERLQMGHRAMALPMMLSGGEQQRVAIARALITEPRLITGDEPTGALDPVTSREVLALFKELHEEDGVSFLIVTHSKEVAAFCDRSLELRDGRFVAEHGSDLNIERLEVGREPLVDDIGTVTLPPDILLRLGGSGGYTVAELEPGRLTLIGETIDVAGGWCSPPFVRPASTSTTTTSNRNAPRAVPPDPWLRREHGGPGPRPNGRGLGAWCGFRLDWCPAFCRSCLVRTDACRGPWRATVLGAGQRGGRNRGGPCADRAGHACLRRACVRRSAGRALLGQLVHVGRERAAGRQDLRQRLARGALADSTRPHRRFLVRAGELRPTSDA